jgi:hypothetical protein
MKPSRRHCSPSTSIATAVVGLALECRGDGVLGQRIATGIHQSA